MASTFSNVVKRVLTPFGGKIPNRDTTTGVLPKPVMVGAATTTPGLAPKPQQATAVKQEVRPVQSVQQPVRGLVKPDPATLDSLKSGLMSVQSGLKDIENKQAKQFSPDNPQIFPNIVSSLATKSAIPGEAYTKAQEEFARANKELADYKAEEARQLGLQEGTGIDLKFVQGRQQAIQRQAEAGAAARQGAVTTASQNIQNALTQKGLEQSALSSAGGLVPEALRYGGFGAAGSVSPEQAVPKYAQDVISGTRSYDDAVSAMSVYGDVGKQMLDSAIRQSNPQFNFAQAQTLGAQQGAIGPAYDFANRALQNVEGAIQQLGSLQKTNIPLVNAIANVGSLQSGQGSEQTRAVVGAVQTLRNAYATLLASARGGTPTDYSSQATAEIPDQPTPNDLKAIRENFEKLGGARRDIYGKPGTGTQTQNTTVKTSAGVINTNW